MAVYMKIKGSKQGELKGGVSAKGYEGQIALSSIDFGVGSPHDMSTGQTSGRRVYRPITIVKTLDKSTPLLMAAIANNENLSQIDVTYVFEGGKTSTAIANFKFINALLRDFAHHADSSATGPETIRFTFEKYEFTWTDGGIMAGDDFVAAVT